MARNYLSLDDIIEKNKGKIATYKIESYIEYNSISTLLSFENGDIIRFYHYQDCEECTEWIKHKPFLGIVKTIELKEKDCKGYESATKTKLFINGKKHSTWVISSNGYYDESISWELVKTPEELADEKRIEEEKIRLKEEEKKKQAKQREEDELKRIAEDKAFRASPQHAAYISRCDEWQEIVKSGLPPEQWIDELIARHKTN